MPRYHSSFVILEQVDSTNNYAMAKVHAGMAKHGDAWFSSNQTQGKGQRGKQWFTAQGQNIAISIIAEPLQLSVTQQFQLSAAVAVACQEFFSRYAGDETSIKWPNDIYWRDRKAGGILIENVIGSKTNLAAGPATATWKYAVAGIGFNINQSVLDPGMNHAVTLKQITGRHFDLEELAREMHELVLQKVEDVMTGAFDTILQRYNDHLFKKEEMVRLKKGNIVFNTVIKGVTEQGQLYTLDTVDNFFEFGEVEWLL